MIDVPSHSPCSFFLCVCVIVVLCRTEFPFFLLGLSYFVAASFTEDKFGVVQKDLSDILCLLLDLQAVC